MSAVIMAGIAIVAVGLLMLWIFVRFIKWLFKGSRPGYSRSRSDGGGFWDDLGGFDGGGDGGSGGD